MSSSWRALALPAAALAAQGCLAFHPGSVILTLDLSDVDGGVRGQLTDIAIFVCQEDGDACANPRNFQRLNGGAPNKLDGLNEAEEIGVVVRQFDGLIRVRAVVAGENAAFNPDEVEAAPEGPILIAEQTIDLDAGEDEFTIRFAPIEVIEPNIVAVSGSDGVLDTTAVACAPGGIAGNDPFLLAWGEGAGGLDDRLVMNTIDDKGEQSASVVILDFDDTAANPREVALAANANCSIVGVGMAVSEDSGLVSNVRGITIPELRTFDFAENTQTIYHETNGASLNLSASFGGNTFFFVWDEDGDGDGSGGASFFQVAASNLTAAPDSEVIFRNEVAPNQSIGNVFSASAIRNSPGAAIRRAENTQTEIALDDVLDPDPVDGIITVALSRSGNPVVDPQLQFNGTSTLITWIECDGSDCSIQGRLIGDLQGFPNDGVCSPEVGGAGCFEIATGQENARDLSAAFGPDGAFVVGWTADNNDAGELRVSFFNPDGPRINPLTGVAGEGVVDSRAGFVQEDTELLFSPAGDLLISWVEQDGLDGQAKIVFIPQPF